MVDNVRLDNISRFPAFSADNKTCKNTKKKVSFGDSFYDSSPSPFQNLKDLAVTLTNDAVGLVGINAVLWWVQNFVNGKILSDKINKYFTSKINADALIPLAYEMRRIKGIGHVEMIHDSPRSEAYFSHIENKVVVGKNERSALFHELGHAMQENKTTLFKQLQRRRGNYAFLSLALYALLSQNKSNKYYSQDDENQGVGTKIKNFLRKSDAIIPLLAFSPELITEAKASIEGINFLRGKIGNGIDNATFKNIRNSYLTCFATYLFIPVSIMLIDILRNSANKIRQKKSQQFIEKNYRLNTY